MSKHKRPVRLEMIQVRVTKDEKDQIFANANGNASRWLRDLGLNPNSLVNKPRYKELKQDPKLVKEVASIGNNINQIARQINTVKKTTGGALNLIAVQARLAETNELLSKLIKQEPDDS
ncbi:MULTISPECIES: plasmid mobilization relaxosome protein MobC [Vibrio]|jgi:hypothetical protein|uniref:Bacterial mobilisation domain-containing protein n=2 Tax=Vibrio harveyi group TaxID=717610 RepID=C8CE64_VIBAL|nr:MULTISPECIES: plasmid mobilization relaxosome protein MobC [Vibrio]MDF5468436.1 plasmid mobilization relaxosome protein MobC [Vibrio parahaemolyticus]ACV04079.1 hypothetical protein pVAE259_00025 [Vibrio alginolyticus]MDF5544276.1 plasmid mobilization relaxosome protein MobC [Vibrio parahaemolyticus]MDW2077909.1 plasmid mobilization relaxosome protein MobC [Vibrio sp. 1863]MDW2265853.1 plasmid mobilization relaxosome protein MobC [Vibrio sp. 1557]